MAQDSTSALVLYVGDNSQGTWQTHFDVPFDKGAFGEIKVAFVRRGLTDYTYDPDTYNVYGYLYAWNGGVYTKTETPDTSTPLYDKNGVATGDTWESTMYREPKNDIFSGAYVEWTGDPITSDDVICITRETIKYQPYSYPNNQKHIESALDNLARQIQELQLAAENSLKVDPSWDYTLEDENKMDPITWLQTIVRSKDKTLREVRVENGYIMYTADDPDSATKTWEVIAGVKTGNAGVISHIRESRYSNDGGVTYIKYLEYSVDGGNTWTPAYNVQSDWNQTDTSALDYIKNKPTLATVATSGSYNDLNNTPSLGTAAFANTTDFATAAQGALADSAVQPGDLGTAATADTTDFATAAQGALADTAIQPTDLATVATTGAYSDLSGTPTIPTVGDGTITITQGGVTKGTFTTNQSGDATIALDAGGGGGGGAVDSVNGYTGVVVLTASDVGALPDSTTIPANTSDLNNDSGFITGITSTDVTTALGYTPYDSSNPSGYTTNTGTVTSVNNVSPVDGNVTLSIPAAQIQSDWNQSDNTSLDYIKNKPSIPTVNDSTITITQGGVTKGSFTLNQASGDTIALDAGSIGYTPDLFDFKFADHELDDMSWLRADMFSWQDGTVYTDAYNHLLNDYQNNTADFYGWAFPAPSTLIIYTVYETPKVGDWVYILHNGKMLESDFITAVGSGSITTSTLGTADRDSTSDTTVADNALVETIAGTTITYYLAPDGHKICLPDQENKVEAIFAATGVAWYYILQEYSVDSFVIADAENTFYRYAADDDLASDHPYAWRITGGNSSIYTDSATPSVGDTVYFWGGSLTSTITSIQESPAQFKLPRTQFGFTGYRDAVGGYVAPGAPNITGSFKATSVTQYGSPKGHITETSGAFSGVSGSNANTDGGDGGANTFGTITLNASSSSSVYGNSTTVQPPATEMYLYFYVGQFSQSATEQTAGLNAELFNSKADIDFHNTEMIDYVVEKQDPSAGNDYTWYRKYKSGWVEQGGQAETVANSGVAVTFPIAMNNANYQIQITCKSSPSNYSTGIANNTITTTGMTISTYTEARLCCWEIKGKAA